MKNERTPRLLRDGYLKGIGFDANENASPAWFMLGLIIGVCVGVMV